MGRITIYVCVDCQNETREKRLQKLDDASRAWSYPCKACGGKLRAFEVDEDKLEEERRQVIDSLHRNRGRS